MTTEFSRTQNRRTERVVVTQANENDPMVTVYTWIRTRRIETLMNRREFNLYREHLEAQGFHGSSVAL